MEFRSQNSEGKTECHLQFSFRNSHFCPFSALLINDSTDGLNAFTIGQFFSGSSYALLYYLYFGMNSAYLRLTFLDVLPDYRNCVINQELFQTIKKFFLQSIIKQLLSEGEKFAMTFFNVLSYSEQGMYDVVNNLGSLCARIVFKPIEEGGFLYFSQTLTRNAPIAEQETKKVAEAYHVLRLMIHFTFLISVIVLTFGLSYSRLFLLLYGGRSLSSYLGVNLLRSYCFYLLFLAVNGSAECFTAATMSDLQLETYTFFMIVFSIIFLACSSLLSQYVGAIGFILANCVNMLCRIMYSFMHILNYFEFFSEGKKQKPLSKSDLFHSLLQSMQPAKPTTSVLMASAICCVISEQVFCCRYGWHFNSVHVGLGAVWFVFALVSVFLFDDNIGYILDRFSMLNKIQSKLKST